MASVLLFSSIRHHCFKVHSAIFGNANSTPEQCWRGHITHLVFLHLCSLISSVLSPGLNCSLLFVLPCSFSLTLFLTRSVSLFLSLSVIYWQWIRDEGVCRRRDGNIQGNGCFRPDFIRSGWEMVGRKVCVFLCVCFSIIRPTGDQLKVHHCEPQPLNCL